MAKGKISINIFSSSAPETKLPKILQSEKTNQAIKTAPTFKDLFLI